MPKKFKLRPTIWGVVVAAWDVWRRLPPKQRKQAMKLARQHGPRIAKQIVGARGGRKKK